MSLNLCALTGTLTRTPTTRFETSSAQVTTFTLKVVEPGKDGQEYTLYVPCEAYGRAGEQAVLLRADDLIGVDGKLKWKSYIDKHGEKKGTLCVLVRQIAALEDA